MSCMRERIIAYTFFVVSIVSRYEASSLLSAGEKPGLWAFEGATSVATMDTTSTVRIQALIGPSAESNIWLRTLSGCAWRNLQRTHAARQTGRLHALQSGLHR